jgi:hypothetical protein
MINHLRNILFQQKKHVSMDNVICKKKLSYNHLSVSTFKIQLRIYLRNSRSNRGTIQTTLYRRRYLNGMNSSFDCLKKIANNWWEFPQLDYQKNKIKMKKNELNRLWKSQWHSTAPMTQHSNADLCSCQMLKMLWIAPVRPSACC